MKNITKKIILGALILAGTAFWTACDNAPTADNISGGNVDITDVDDDNSVKKTGAADDDNHNKNVEGAADPNAKANNGDGGNKNDGNNGGNDGNGGGEVGGGDPAQQVAGGGSFSASDLVFVHNGVNISLNANMADITAAIGEPVSFSEAPSCNYEGNDKVFVYSGFTIYTYPSGDVDKILEIELTGAATPKGITTGMTLEQAVSAYGTNYTADGQNYKYSVSNSCLYFNIKNGKINRIGFRLEL